MDMKTNPFFALRQRLYDTAAAGCAVIREDFRLKRAVDAFQPLAEKNKVFSRLYEMCSKLQESEQPALLLSECIALADAVAVTQSGFQDDSDAVVPPQQTIPQVHQFFYQDLQSAIRTVQNTSGEPDTLPADLCQIASDPRLLHPYLSRTDSKSERFDRVSRVFENIYGPALVPMLTERIDMQNPKSSGQQLVYIRRISGTACNAYYRDLALNPDAPADVRIRAMEAMADLPDNAEDLLKIYQTEKGKVKTAALKCLVRTNSPLADPVLQKLFSKPKDSNYALAAEGNTELCRAYAEEQILAYLAPKENRILDKTSVYLLQMLANKPDTAELFLKMAQFAKKWKSLEYELIQKMNRILIENLCRHDDPAYQELICKLYQKEPAVFFKARLCLALMTDPENALIQFETEGIQYLEDTAKVLRNLWCIPGLPWMMEAPTDTFEKCQYSMKMFDKLPHSLTDFISRCCQTRSVIKDESLFLLMTFGWTLLRCCSKDEYSRAEHAVRLMSEMLLLKGDSRLSSAFSLYCAAKGDPKGMVQKAVISHLKTENKVVRDYVMSVCADHAPADVVLADLRELLKTLPQCKNLSADLVKKQISEIEQAIKRLEK